MRMLPPLWRLLFQLVALFSGEGGTSWTSQIGKVNKISSTLRPPLSDNTEDLSSSFVLLYSTLLIYCWKTLPLQYIDNFLSGAGVRQEDYLLDWPYKSFIRIAILG